MERYVFESDTNVISLWATNKDEAYKKLKEMDSDFCGSYTLVKTFDIKVTHIEKLAYDIEGYINDFESGVTSKKDTVEQLCSYIAERAITAVENDRKKTDRLNEEIPTVLRQWAAGEIKRIKETYLECKVCGHKESPPFAPNDCCPVCRFPLTEIFGLK